MAEAKNQSFLVVAIDFGTTYSGYAFSFKNEFIKDPGKISCNQWAAGSNQLISLKTPTALLLKWDEHSNDFIAEGFGYDAEDKYTRLVEDEEHEDYFLVRRFKMDLYKQTAVTGLSRSLRLEVGKGRSISTMRVFSMCIAYLKDHFMETLEKRAARVMKGDIRWVLTVPAIWTDGAKQFMRESAVMAGIDSETLTIALEPEAAALYCVHLPALDSASDTDVRYNRFPVGTNYMVVDCGGGTIDVCVHEIVGRRVVAEKHVASGGKWGGTVVDENFLQIWVDVVGSDVFEKFKAHHSEDVTEMYRDFEYKKRSLKTDQKNLTIRVPVALTNLYTQMKHNVFETALSQSKYADKITVHRDKVRIDMEIVRSCFDPPICKTINHIDRVLKDKACAEVNTIILVGGFAESCFLQDAIRKQYSGMDIVVPEDPGLAVVKGAVLFGHAPFMVHSRVAKYTYGIRANKIMELAVPVNRTGYGNRRRNYVHSELDLDVIRLSKRDTFSIHVKKGQQLQTGKPQSAQKYYPELPFQTMIQIEVFASTEEEPELVTDASCSLIGTVDVDILDTSFGTDKPVSVTMTFGGTEIEVKAVEDRLQKVTQARLNLLQ